MRYTLLQDGKATRYVALLGQGLSTQIGRPELRYYFAVLDTAEVNAYACPGGYIFITKGALMAMTNESQLAGVLAHEIAHVNQRHVVNALNIKGKDDSASSIFSSLIGGSSEAIRVTLDQITDKAFSLLFEKGLDKQDEFEADELAVQILVSTGYQVEQYKNYLSKLPAYMDSNAGKTLSKTHPSVAERIKQIHETVAQNDIKSIQGKVNKGRFNESIHF